MPSADVAAHVVFGIRAAAGIIAAVMAAVALIAVIALLPGGR